MATSEGIPSSIDIEFLELNDNPYYNFRTCKTSVRYIYKYKIKDARLMVLHLLFADITFQ